MPIKILNVFFDFFNWFIAHLKIVAYIVEVYGLVKIILFW